MTECLKRPSLVLKCMCFAMISTFNLIPLATGMTGQDIRKTRRFYQLVQLVVSCPSFPALEYMKLSHFEFLSEFLGNRYD